MLDGFLIKINDVFHVGDLNESNKNEYKVLNINDVYELADDDCVL